MSTISQSLTDAIVQAVEVPAHIAACASACASDLMYGPTWSIIPQGKIEAYTDDCLHSLHADAVDAASKGDVIEETYVGQVGNALRAFIDDLPCECWVDMDWGCYMIREPDSHEFIETDEDDDSDDIEEHDGIRGRWQEAYLNNVYHCDRKDIVRALFGRTIAHEFS